MSPTCLPAMGAHDTLSRSLEAQETLLVSALLEGPQGLHAVFLSEDAQGVFRLRSCQGGDDRWMVWCEQRSLRSGFGRAYAEAVMGACLARLERAGWQLTWQARREREPSCLALAA